MSEAMDVDTQAPAAAGGEGAVVKGKGKAVATGGKDDGPRFTVKKVSDPCLRFLRHVLMKSSSKVECCRPMGLGHCRRQLRDLQESHHGLV